MITVHEYGWWEWLRRHPPQVIGMVKKCGGSVTVGEIKKDGFC